MRQRELSFAARGGKRRGAGRKRTSAFVAHRARPVHLARHPLHVTLRLAPGLPSLREDGARRALRSALRAGAQRFGLRVVHVSAQSNHVHLLCEAEDREALACGMKGLKVRIARALNRAWRRTGVLFADRYHARALRTPREVRNALAYVFHNARRHGARFTGALDRHSSAASFDGWKEHRGAPLVAPWLARACTWLLAIGWRRHGLLSVLGG